MNLEKLPAKNLHKALSVNTPKLQHTKAPRTQAQVGASYARTQVGARTQTQVGASYANSSWGRTQTQVGASSGLRTQRTRVGFSGKKNQQKHVKIPIYL